MTEQEPTTGELGRWMQRLEMRVTDGLSDLRAEVRGMLVEFRETWATVALLNQRMSQAENRDAESAQGLKDLDTRLQVVETDLAARKEAHARDRRTLMWIATGISLVGLIAGVVLKFVP